MISEKNLLCVLPTLGFDHFDYVLPSFQLRGIAVLWCNNTIHALILHK